MQPPNTIKYQSVIKKSMIFLLPATILPQKSLTKAYLQAKKLYATIFFTKKNSFCTLSGTKI